MEEKVGSDSVLNSVVKEIPIILSKYSNSVNWMSINHEKTTSAIFIAEENDNFAPHYHADQNEKIIVKDGTLFLYFYVLDGGDYIKTETIVLKSGQAYIIPKKQVHGAIIKKGTILETHWEPKDSNIFKINFVHDNNIDNDYEYDFSFSELKKGLHYASERLDMIDHIPVGLVKAEHDNDTLVAVNSTFASWFNSKPIELSGMKFMDYIVSDMTDINIGLQKMKEDGRFPEESVINTYKYKGNYITLLWRAIDYDKESKIAYSTAELLEKKPA